MKKLAILLLAAVALMTLGVATPVAATTEIHVYAGQSIQAAVDGAITGDIIIVHPGTYNEQVIISKELTLKGYGDATVIQPTQAVAQTFTLFTRNGGGKTAAIVVVNSGGAPANVQKLKVDGKLITLNKGNLTQATSFVGVLYRDSAGVLEGVTVTDTGIKNASAILLTAVNSTGYDVKVTNCQTSNYLKNGITATGPVVVNMMNNTVTGKGPITTIAQNGIQVSYGATGTVHKNKVSKIGYVGANWAATGILVFESDGVSVQGNTVKDCQTAIGIETWGYILPSATNNKVVNNTVTEADWGITVVSHAWTYTYSNPVADNNKITNNTITASDGDVGIYVGAWSDITTYTATADNNKVITNKISGFATAIYDEGTRTKEHANAAD